MDRRPVYKKYSRKQDHNARGGWVLTNHACAHCGWTPATFVMMWFPDRRVSRNSYCSVCYSNAGFT